MCICFCNEANRVVLFRRRMYCCTARVLLCLGGEYTAVLLMYCTVYKRMYCNCTASVLYCLGGDCTDSELFCLGGECTASVLLYCC